MGPSGLFSGLAAGTTDLFNGPIRNNRMFTTFEHTADLGLRVEADSIESLFEEAAAGLISIICRNPEAIGRGETRQIRVRGTDWDELLHDWLDELLYLFSAEHWLAARCRVAFDAEGLTAEAGGEPVDRQRHELGQEVKAITYHRLKVARHENRWLAEVIVDL